MKQSGQDLVRFGVAMEASLIEQLDALAEQRGSTRSELLRDLARAAVGRGLAESRAPAVAAVTIVYDHHIRELTERLNTIQHELEEQVRSTMHVHLDHAHCLEVIVMRGRADLLTAAADRLLGARGVTHGGVEIIPEAALTGSQDGSSEHAHPHRHPPRHPAKRSRTRR